jgi:hypothetical protein
MLALHEARRSGQGTLPFALQSFGHAVRGLHHLQLTACLRYVARFDAGCPGFRADLSAYDFLSGRQLANQRRAYHCSGVRPSGLIEQSL